MGPGHRFRKRCASVQLGVVHLNYTDGLVVCIVSAEDIERCLERDTVARAFHCTDQLSDTRTRVLNCVKRLDVVKNASVGFRVSATNIKNFVYERCAVTSPALDQRCTLEPLGVGAVEFPDFVVVGTQSGDVDGIVVDCGGC